MSKSQPWWKSVFGEEYLAAFDRQYSAESGHNESTHLRRVLKLKKGSRVLDVACGQGRHAVALSMSGCLVTGIDSSENLLRVAKRRADEAGVRPDFRAADMRSYVEKGAYDAVMLLGNAFGYFDDATNERVIRNQHASLRPGGYFILDLANVAGMLREKMEGKWVQKNGPIKVTTVMSGFDAGTFRVQMEWRFESNGKMNAHHGALRFYTPPEISSLMESCGFEIVTLLGDISAAPYSIDSRRCVIVARKPKSSRRPE